MPTFLGRLYITLKEMLLALGVRVILDDTVERYICIRRTYINGRYLIAITIPSRICTYNSTIYCVNL